MEYRRLAPTAPEGLRDLLPAEAKKRRALEARLRHAFEARGFGELICPSFEYYDILAIEAGDAVQKDMVRFLGPDGRLLALRPEMTTTIARVAAQHYGGDAGPLRFSYLANVFRANPSQQGQPREFRQAGVELIGSASQEGDIEVISVFFETLAAAGLNEFVIGVGRMDFFSGLLEDIGLSAGQKTALLKPLTRRNLVGFRQAVANLGLGRARGDKLLAVPALRGDVSVVQRAADFVAGDRSGQALAGLSRTVEALAAAGFADKLIIDFGIFRDFAYYTGVVFEAYCATVGAPIGGGGRYDNLLAEFGRPAPAAGFALGLERLQSAIDAQGASSTIAGGRDD